MLRKKAACNFWNRVIGAWCTIAIPEGNTATHYSDPENGSFQKLEVPYFFGGGGPYNKDPTISGNILGSLIFGNSPKP